MTSKTLQTTVRRMPAPLASSRTHSAPDPERPSVLPRKQDQKSESDTNHRVPPVEPDLEQASVIGEAERPQPPSEKPEAS